MFDRDTLNDINQEERAYQNWLREEKNKILRMYNPESKRKAWARLHPKPDYSNLTEEELTQPY